MYITYIGHPSLTFSGRGILECVDVAYVLEPVVHLPVGLAALLGELVPVLGLGEQLAHRALR